VLLYPYTLFYKGGMIMTIKKDTLTRPGRLAYLESYFIGNLAENPLDETNFDEDVLHAIYDLRNQYPNDKTRKKEMKVWVNNSEEANSLIRDLKTLYYVKRIFTENIIPIAVQGKDLIMGNLKIRNFFLPSLHP